MKTFAEAFMEELGKLAKKKKKRGTKFPPTLQHALFGAGLGGAASMAAAPFTYSSLRMGRSLNPKAALLQTLLRIGERAAYGAPIGAAGGWMGWNFFNRKRKR